MRKSVTRDFATWRFEGDDFAFLPAADGGYLCNRTGRYLNVLAFEDGQLTQLRMDKHGRPCAVRQTLSLKGFWDRAARVDQDECGQQHLFPLDPDGSAIRDFVRLIPDSLWQRIKPYPAPMQLRVLQLFLHAGDRAVWLHDHDSFGLVALLATADWLLRRHVPPETLRRWLHLPQWELLQHLGLPGTPRVARIIRKIPAAACEYTNLRGLRALHDARLARELSHLAVVTGGVLESLEYLTPRRILSPRCLREVSELDEDESFCFLLKLRALVSCHRQIERCLGEALPLPLFSSPWTVRNLDEVRLYKRLPAFRNCSRLMRPPLPDEPGLLSWIRTPGDLLREGREMHNCVYSYLEAIVRGEAAAAIVQPGELRATLMIVKTSSRRPWRIEDLRLHDDEEAPESLRMRLLLWLEALQGAPPYEEHWEEILF